MQINNFIDKESEDEKKLIIVDIVVCADACGLL